ncbi:MAG: ActD-like protein [Candidatus Latescibacteria bacterium]|nr:ActD-like protein [Candidatus Latescibacterota bacterium]
MNRDAKLYPDWELERYLLGELPSPRLTQIRRAAALDPRLQSRLQALQTSNQEILQRYPAAWMAGRIQRRQAAAKAPKPQVWRQRASRWWPAPALGLAILLVFAPSLWEQQPQVRLKGLEPHLELFRKTAAGSQALDEGGQVAVGDIIQVAYQAAGQDYGAVLSIDGRHAVTLHLPDQGTWAIALDEGLVPLDFSYELDDAPHWERFYLITAADSFALEPILEAARRLPRQSDALPDSLKLAPGLSQSLFTLYKE